MQLNPQVVDEILHLSENKKTKTNNKNEESHQEPKVKPQKEIIRHSKETVIKKIPKENVNESKSLISRPYYKILGFDISKTTIYIFFIFIFILIAYQLYSWFKNRKTEIVINKKKDNERIQVVSYKEQKEKKLENE